MANQIVMFALLFAVMYFLLIRPQQKRAQEHKQMLDSLKKGDEVITTGGLLGRISGISEQIVTLEVAEKIRLRVMRNHIAGKRPEGGGATSSN